MQGQPSPSSVTVTKIPVCKSTPSAPASSLKTETSKNPRDEILKYLEKKEFIDACLKNKEGIITHLTEQMDLLHLYEKKNPNIAEYKLKLQTLLDELTACESEEQRRKFISSMREFINFSYKKFQQYSEEYGIDLSSLQSQIQDLKDILYIQSSMLTNIYFCELFKEINISDKYKSQHQDILSRNYSLQLLLLNYFLEHISDSKHQTIENTDLSNLAIIIRNKISEASKLKILDIKIFSKYKEYFESLNKPLCEMQDANELNNFFQTFIFEILKELIRFKPSIKFQLSQQIKQIQQQLSKIEPQEEANQQFEMLKESLNSQSLTIEQMTKYAEQILQLAFYSDCQTLKKKIADLPHELSEKLTNLNKKILEISIVYDLAEGAALNTKFKLLIVDALLPEINKLAQTKKSQQKLDDILFNFYWQRVSSCPEKKLGDHIFNAIKEIQENETISLSNFFDKINSIRENYNQILQKQKELEEKKGQEEEEKQEEEKKRQKEAEKKRQEEEEKKRQEEKRRLEERERKRKEAEKKRQEEEEKKQEEEKRKQEEVLKLTEENGTQKETIQTQATKIQKLTQNTIAEQKERLSELFQKFIIDPDKYKKTTLENSEQISDLISTIIKHPINETTIDCFLQFMTLYINEPLQIQQKILEYKQNPQNKENYESFLKFIELFTEMESKDRSKNFYIFNARLLHAWLQNPQQTFQTIQPNKANSSETSILRGEKNPEQDSTYKPLAPGQQPISERVLDATTQKKEENMPPNTTATLIPKIQILQRGQPPTTPQQKPNLDDFREFPPLP